MNIKFAPTDPNYPADKRAYTNIGEFLPGEVHTVAPGQEKTAEILVENGEFVVTDDMPNIGTVEWQRKHFDDTLPTTTEAEISEPKKAKK